MKVLICGTEQVVPDNANINKPWITEVAKKKVIHQGDKLWLDDTQYIVTLIPKNQSNYSMGWFAFAISLKTGSRYDNGHFVSSDDWNSFPIPSDWE